MSSRVQWEYDGLEMDGPPSFRDSLPEKWTASVDGGTPRTPAEWLENLRITNHHDPHWKDAYEVLRDLLGGTDG